MNRIFNSSFAKAFQPQETGIAFAAGETFRRRIVTTVSERKIDAEIDRFANDFGFGKLDQRRVNLKTSAFCTGFRSNIGQSLKRFDELRTAIGVAAVINCIYAEKNIDSGNHLRPGKRVSEKNCVAGRDIRDWNAVPDFLFRAVLRNVDVTSKG